LAQLRTGVRADRHALAHLFVFGELALAFLIARGHADLGEAALTQGLDCLFRIAVVGEECRRQPCLVHHGMSPWVTWVVGPKAIRCQLPLLATCLVPVA